MYQFLRCLARPVMVRPDATPAPEGLAMLSLWRQEHLPALVARLAARPGHETVRTLLAELLHNGLNATYTTEPMK